MNAKIHDIKPPNTLSCGTRKNYLAAPKIGQQSLEILEELGYARKATMELVRDGIIIDGNLKT